MNYDTVNNIIQQAQMKMTPLEFEERMEFIRDAYRGDTEAVHAKMDDAMVEMLRALGYQEGAKVFKKQGKWYA